MTETLPLVTYNKKVIMISFLSITETLKKKSIYIYIHIHIYILSFIPPPYRSKVASKYSTETEAHLIRNKQLFTMKHDSLIYVYIYIKACYLSINIYKRLSVFNKTKY